LPRRLARLGCHVDIGVTVAGSGASSAGIATAVTGFGVSTVSHRRRWTGDGGQRPGGGAVVSP
jgi:hypothetical protein